MGMFSYLGSLVKNDTGNSSKSFTLVLSAIISFIAGLTMCTVIAYDGFKDGVIDTDLEKAGIFMLCMGGYMAGSSVSKIFGDRAENRIYDRMDRMGMSDNEYRRRRKKNGNVYVGPPPGDYGVDDGIGEDEEVLDP